MFNHLLMRVAPCVAAVLVYVGINSAAHADTAESSALATDASGEAVGMSSLPAIVVTAQHLDDRRSQIQTQTGADTYTVDAAAIAQMPAGDNTLLNQVI